MKTRLLLALLVVAAVAAAASIFWVRKSQDPSSLSARYVKREFHIPMRDGIKLYTAVYTPKDTSRSYPFLLTRTPFGATPYGESAFPARLGPSEALVQSGYIFVVQDVRGRFQSEGQFVDMPPQIDHPENGQTTESTDAYDSIEWLLHNVEHNNGKVGVWGISYAGF